MSLEELLDQLLVPRPNGSESLSRVASFIETTLASHTPDVTLQTFTAAPHALQLVFSAGFLLMLGFAAALLARRHALGLVLASLAAALLFVEMEWLWSPLSGLLPASESNVPAVFPGREGGPTLVFTAHYDSATQFGDHFAWNAWGSASGVALFLAVALALACLRRRRREISRSLLVPASALIVAPFAAMAWFFGAGPLLAAPSPGALDNGGSVAALLRLAEVLAQRAPGAPTTVKLVFLAAEEERALGSWHFAASLDPKQPVAVINLESLGASRKVGYVADEGFQLRRYRPSSGLVELVADAARELGGEPVLPVHVPRVLVTDARSFLARGIPAVTLLGTSEGGLPHRLHSVHDSRDRLSVAALERSVELLAAVVARADRDPEFSKRDLGRSNGSRR